MKYIVGYIGNSAELSAFVFQRTTYHYRAAAYKGMRVVSAGFFSVLPDGKIHAHGVSESLGVGSNPPVDEPLIAQAYETYKKTLEEERMRHDSASRSRGPGCHR